MASRKISMKSFHSIHMSFSKQPSSSIFLGGKIMWIPFVLDLFMLKKSIVRSYIPTMGLPFLLEEICGHVDRSWEYINRSQTHECANWGWGRAIPRKGIYKRNCRCSGGSMSAHKCRRIHLLAADGFPSLAWWSGRVPQISWSSPRRTLQHLRHKAYSLFPVIAIHITV